MSAAGTLQADGRQRRPLGVAAVLFGALNTTFDPALGLSVGIAIFLSGLTTSAVVYLLSERILRTAQSRAMAGGAT